MALYEVKVVNGSQTTTFMVAATAFETAVEIAFAHIVSKRIEGVIEVTKKSNSPR